MRAFLYTRVSTDDQDAGMQRRELEEFAGRRGWQIVEIFSDVSCGASTNRPALDSMLAQVRRRKSDVVVCWKLDRFARSLKFLVNTLEEFESLGVLFVALHDQIDMTTPGGRLMLHIVAAFAQFERDIIRERSLAGVANARAKGKHIGRPRLRLDLDEIRALRRYGDTWDQIAAKLGVSEASLRTFDRHARRNGIRPTWEKQE
jgi:DNA invertase Pin-like site-specific DNA recombinase